MAVLGNTSVISLTLLDGVIGNLNPKTTNVYTLGTSSLKWNNVYATTFTGNLTGNATISAKDGFTYSGIGTASDNVARPIWFAYNGVNGRPVIDNDFKYNPANNTITIGTGSLSPTQYSGNAATATTASKLSNTSAVGAADRPVYFTNGGVPSQTTYRMAATNVSATGARAITDNLETGIWYVSGTNVTGLYSQSDGAAYVNKYSDSWIAEIYQDYRTGQIAVRGKNNGTWQAWRQVLDSSNYTNYTVTKTGTGASGTWGISISGNAATATKFASAQSVTLTGDITGTASSQAGWSIATTIGTGKVTNAMLAGSIANAKLANSSITVGSKTISLGGSATLAEIGAAAASHAHGSITNDGKLGTASRVVVTDASKNITVADLTVSNPTDASSEAISFIDTISQSSQGKITPTRKSVRVATASASGVVSTTAQTFSGVKTFDNGIHVYGTISTQGTGSAVGTMYPGGAYHSGHNSIVLHGDSAGISGIGFTSEKATKSGTTTNINGSSDRAFIQYHAHGVTPAAEGTAPTLATSGELGTLVIGVGNDATDTIRLQAPGTTGILHQIGATAYPIPHTTNTNGSVGGTTTPVYVEAGVIKAGTALGTASQKAESYFVKAITSTDNAITRFDGTSGQIQDSKAILDDNGNLLIANDASIKIYHQTNTTYGLESYAIQTCFDNQDPATSTYTSSYENRCNLLLQPRGGQVYIGTDLTTPGDTNYSLYVTGDTYLKNTLVVKNIIPDATDTYSLGTASKRWNAYFAPKTIGGRNYIYSTPITGGRSTIEGKTVVFNPNANNGDSYFYVKAARDIPVGIYTFSMDCEGLGADEVWTFGIINQNSGKVISVKNGRSALTFEVTTAITAKTKIILDDINRPTTSTRVVFSNFMWEAATSPSDFSYAPEEIESTYAKKIASTKYGIAYYSDTDGTFGSKASANGALYATSANGALQWGTLPVSQGGTGQTTFTANAVLIGNGTNGISTISKTNANTANTLVQRDGSGNFSAGTITATLSGNASTATKAGVATMWLYPENNNELNFGGTNNSTTIYFGYRAKDSKAIPTKFIFGGSTGAADIQVKTVYLGSGTSSYVSSTQYTGNAATATKFASAQSVTLTGDVTGTASSQAGWSIATTIGAGKVTNAMLAGSIANAKLANSSITVGSKTISLGSSATLAEIGAAAASHTHGNITNDGKLGTASKAVITDANKNITVADLTVNNPTDASSEAISFIDTISQSSQGKITPTRKAVRVATTSDTGVVKVGTGLGVSSGTISVTYGTSANTALQGNQVLFKLNNGDKTASSAATFYAPTAGGTAGYPLIGAGTTTAPAWYGGTVFTGTAAASWKTDFNGTTDATSTTAAAVVMDGGLGVAKQLRTGGSVTLGTLDGNQHVINGSVRIESKNGSYNEGLRINRSSTGYANIYLGGTRNSTSGNQAGGWWIGTLSTPADASSTSTSTYFQISHNSTSTNMAIKGTWDNGWIINPRLTVGTATLSTTYTFYVNGTSYFNNNMIIEKATASTTKATGALVIKGANAGLGVAGQVNAETFRVNEKVKFEYNATDDSLDFVWA